MICVGLGRSEVAVAHVTSLIGLPASTIDCYEHHISLPVSFNVCYWLFGGLGLLINSFIILK